MFLWQTYQSRSDRSLQNGTLSAQQPSFPAQTFKYIWLVGSEKRRAAWNAQVWRQSNSQNWGFLGFHLLFLLKFIPILNTKDTKGNWWKHPLNVRWKSSDIFAPILMGGRNRSCYGDLLKIFLVLLFLHQLKCLFSVNFSYLFYNVTCCETASYPPWRSHFSKKNCFGYHFSHIRSWRQIYLYVHTRWYHCRKICTCSIMKEEIFCFCHIKIR